MTVRGCEKRIYHVKNTESELFDEAYLILKPRERRRHAEPRELEREAMRIVNGAASGNCYPASSSKREKMKAFILGNLASCILMGAVMLILWLAL